MTVIASETSRLHGIRDLEDTRRLVEDERVASEIAATWGRPVILLHNCTPGRLAECHMRIFSHGDPRSLPSLLEGRLIIQFATVAQTRDIAESIRNASASDPLPDKAASVLVSAFDGTGSRIRT